MYSGQGAQRLYLDGDSFGFVYEGVDADQLNMGIDLEIKSVGVCWLGLGRGIRLFYLFLDRLLE